MSGDKFFTIFIPGLILKKKIVEIRLMVRPIRPNSGNDLHSLLYRIAPTSYILSLARERQRCKSVRIWVEGGADLPDAEIY